MTGGAASRRKGAGYERDVVNWLRIRGYLNVERRIAGMSDDTGDITGWPGVVIECKNHKAITLGAWVAQLEEEATRARADHAALFIKRRGTTDVGSHYVVMLADDWLDLMKEAGR